MRENSLFDVICNTKNRRWAFCCCYLTSCHFSEFFEDRVLLCNSGWFGTHSVSRELVTAFLSQPPRSQNQSCAEQSASAEMIRPYQAQSCCRQGQRRVLHFVLFCCSANRAPCDESFADQVVYLVRFGVFLKLGSNWLILLL